MASGKGFGDRTARPYRRRRPLPALIVIAVLCLGALVVWVNAITGKGDIDSAIRCDPPAQAPPGAAYTPLSHDALDSTAPIPQTKVAVRVLNASSTRGAAALTTENIAALGFEQAAPPDNDPAYPPHHEAKCRGQIRFGENGAPAARTLSLVAPCVELVRDNRKDASVDLSVGSAFGQLQPKAEAKQVLDQLKAFSAQQPTGGAEQSAGQTPKIDQTLLAAARDVTC
ncbi:envelope integrity protein Cei [Amycolatopsis minnesotensis]|uniref:Envelope integrity protein Cei n=1 Tax=Amycolatopsis minnesotensis TaxID=337894 RepID=A0ABP5CCA2_9PSEU